MINDELDSRLRELFHRHSTAEQRFAAIPDGLAESLLHLSLSGGAQDPALLWDAVTKAIQKFCAYPTTPEHPRNLLCRMVRCRVIDERRKEANRTKWFQPDKEDVSSKDPDLLARQADLFLPNPMFTDSFDRLADILRRLANAPREHSLEWRTYRLFVCLLLEGVPLEIEDLRQRAVSEGLSSSAMPSALKRFRAEISKAVRRDPELEFLLKERQPRRIRKSVVSPAKEGRAKPSPNAATEGTRRAMTHGHMSGDDYFPRWWEE